MPATRFRPFTAAFPPLTVLFGTFALVLGSCGTSEPATSNASTTTNTTVTVPSSTTPSTTTPPTTSTTTGPDTGDIDALLDELETLLAGIAADIDGLAADFADDAAAQSTS